MKVFAFDPTEYSDQYQSEGWVHIREGITEEFYRSVQEYAREELVDHVLEGFAIKGKKEQALYDFPDTVDDYPGELFDVVAELCGLNRETMTLSERHIQMYEPNAAPEPLAHKDRFGSQVSVGLSITIPPESRLVLYPYDDREVNPFNSSAALLNALTPDQRPEVVLKNAREVELADQPRDVVAFPGSTTWHFRRRAANALNLYLKFNDFNCDTLGEDPRTAELRSQTLNLLSNRSNGMADLVPVIARRLDLVTRNHTRNHWQEVLQARLYGEEPFALTDRQFDVLQALDGNRDVATIARDVNGAGAEEAERDIVALAERGAIDLIPRG